MLASPETCEPVGTVITVASCKLAVSPVILKVQQRGMRYVPLAFSELDIVGQVVSIAARTRTGAADNLRVGISQQSYL